MEYKNVYIVISKTGTLLSKIICGLTNDEYAHASISFTGDLTEMYSFGRLNPYNPFIGGFVHESPKSGTFKRFRKTRIQVFELSITEEEYSKLREYIGNIDKNKSKYLYNYIGVALAALNIKFKKKNWYYCSELVYRSLTETGIVESYIKGPIRPEMLRFIGGSTLIYTGLMCKYA